MRVGIAVMLALLAGCSSGPAGSTGGSSGGGSSAGAGSTGSSGASGSSGSSGGSGTTGGACSGLTLGAGDSVDQLTFQDGDPALPQGSVRTATVHVPPGYDATRPTELVLLFHGFFEAIPDLRATTGFDALSDARGFIVVYPAGHDQTWNAGTCCGFAGNAQIDDVGYTRALIDDLATKYCIDRSRIFAAGLDNGGMFALRLGCELSDRVAAVGSVAGNLAISSCAPARPVPFYWFRGTQPSSLDGMQATADQTLAALEQADACTGASPQTVFSQGPASCQLDRGSASGSAIEDCVNDGGNDCWPTTSASPGGVACTADLDASTQLLDFFAAHPMAQPQPSR